MPEKVTQIHLSDKELGRLEANFKAKFQTESMFSHAMDTLFTGAKTVHVKMLKSVPLQKYDRTKNFSDGSRYGRTVEMGDYEHTYTMTQDDSFAITVDNGNNQDSINKKNLANITAVQRDEQIVPSLDAYRITKWCKEAGIHYALSSTPTTAKIISNILDLRRMMLDKHVPREGLTLVLPRKWTPTLMLSDEWKALDSLLGKSLPSGYIGTFAGMTVYEVDSDLLGNDAYFMIVHKESIIAPMKINQFKAHLNPPGLNGLLVEFRMYHDAFVLGHRANGVAVACSSASLTEAPTITLSGDSATIARSGATVYYTLDGSDPRYSVDRVSANGTATVTVPAGATVKACAEKSGSFMSSVTEKTYEG